jgi:hypothetical protein
MSSPTKPTKKQRALPRVWARFFSIPAVSLFSFKGKRYVKGVIPFCAYHNGTRAFFAPWTRVQTDVLVRDARPGGKSGPAPSETIIHADWETSGGTTPEQNEAREFVKQPNSDNGVSGPTS